MGEKKKEIFDHKIIYFTNNDNNIYESKEELKKDEEKIEVNKYIAPTIFSIFIYSLCAWSTKVGFSEIVDLELPFIILLTLLLKKSAIQGHSKITYSAYIIISCICYLFINESYSLFLIISLTGVLITDYLEKIYYNKNDYHNMKIEKIEIKHIFSRLKYYIFLSFILFIISLLLGYLYPGVFQPVVMPSVENLHNGVKEGTIQLETLSLFTNNFSVACRMIIGGFYFSTSTIYMLIFNALFVGYSCAVTDIVYFLLFTIPHGIIELSAIILAGATGLRITHSLLVILNGIISNNNTLLNKSCTLFIEMFLDAIIMIFLITIMLLIAAFIEANLTIDIGTYLYNIGRF